MKSTLSKLALSVFLLFTGLFYMDLKYATSHGSYSVTGQVALLNTSTPSFSANTNTKPREDRSLRDHIHTATNDLQKNNYSIVFGIPTRARKGNPDYLYRTLLSMQKVGVKPGQMWVMHTVTDETHIVLENASKLLRFHRVEPCPTPVDINYKPHGELKGNLNIAFKDDKDRKRWRITEARDFMWLMENLLNESNAPFIGFIQDDVEWVKKLPKIQKSTGITSLWRNIRYGKGRDCGSSAFCGMVAIIFRRDFLRKFLDWMKPFWKELPIDWTLKKFVSIHKISIPVADYVNVRHIGGQSSYDKQVRKLENTNELDAPEEFKTSKIQTVLTSTPTIYH